MAGLGVEGHIAGKHPRLPTQISVTMWSAGAVFVALLALAVVLPRVKFPMRPSLRIRIEFEPSRLSTSYLRSAYEQAAPVVRRVAGESSVARVSATDRVTRVRPLTQARTSK